VAARSTSGMTAPHPEEALGAAGARGFAAGGAAATTPRRKQP
jgi:hypothetical protein